MMYVRDPVLAHIIVLVGLGMAAQQSFDGVPAIGKQTFAMNLPTVRILMGVEEDTIRRPVPISRNSGYTSTGRYSRKLWIRG